MPDNETVKVVQNSDTQKGAPAPKLTVTQSVPLREGAKAPHITMPPNIQTTTGPVSVTTPKK